MAPQRQAFFCKNEGTNAFKQMYLKTKQKQNRHGRMLHVTFFLP